MKNPIFDLVTANKLPNDEVLNLFRQLKTAKSKAKLEQLKNKILLANLGLVIAGCKRFFSYKRLDADDMIQEGILGLSTAIDKFDVETGNQFSTYAYWWIKQRVRRYLESQKMDKIRSNSMSLDTSFTDDNDSKTFADMLIDKHETAAPIEETDEMAVIKRVADSVLTERERLIFNLRYGI